MLARVYIVAVLVVFACSSNSKSNKDCEPDENGKCGEEKNNDAALQDAAVMPVWHVEPEVRITNDSEFTVMEGGLSKNSSQGEYMYGIYYMEYTGSELIVFVEVDITYKDREGNALYTENSFLWNDGYVELSVASTNSYATPDSPYLVLRIIEQLGEKGIQITVSLR